MANQSSLKRAVVITAIALVYFLAARLGLSLATAPAQVTAIWPPAGVGLAALVIFGMWAWPGIAIGAFLANAFANEPIITAFLICIGNTLECVFAAWMVGRTKLFRPSLERVTDVILLLAPVALVSSAIAASIGVASLWIGNLVMTENLGRVWCLWWLGDATGIAIFAPALLTWSHRYDSSAWKWKPIEAALYLAAVASTSVLICAGPYPYLSQFKFLLFPFIVWSAYRLGQRFTAAGVVLISIIAVWGQVHWPEPLTGAQLNEQLLLIQGFIGVLALTGLSLAAVVTERRRLESELASSQVQLEQRVLEKTASLQQEVDARKQSEDALAANRKTLQDFIDNMSTFTAKVDTTGKFLLVGKTAQLASGQPLEELMKMNLLDGPWFAFDKMVQRRVKNAFAQAAAGTPVKYDEYVRVFGNVDMVIDFSLNPVFAADGSVEYVLAEGRDITAQKNAEEQLRAAETKLKHAYGELETRVEQRTLELSRATGNLRRSEQRLQAIIDNSNAVVHVKDLDGRYVLVNREWEKANQTARGKVIGKTMYEIYPKEVADSLAENDRRVAASEEAFQFEEEVPHVGGARTYISNKFALRDQNGAPYAICGIATDITERKRIEEREKRAKEQAEAANRSKDEFLAVVSHELRTPLTPILGWTRMLRTGTLTPAEMARGLETIERNVKAQGQLIEDLLDISRIVTGKLMVDRRPMKLGEVILSAIDTVRPAAKAKQVTLNITVNAASGQMSGDPERLRQVVWNLVNNAIKFSPKGGEVSVKLHDVLDHTELIVEDQGEGIAPEFLPHMFNRFSQADSTTTRQHGGLGLGLAIVKTIVEIHGGTVHAISDGKGRGSKFLVRLPRKVSAEERGDSGPRYRTQLAGGERVPQLQGLKILAIDDEKDTRDMVALALEQWGATVTTAESAASGMDAIHLLKPNIVICDIGMPGLDGYEFVRMLREEPADRGGLLPIIALTAYARAEDQAKILSAGFERHIPKPVDPFELASTVATVAEKYPQS